MATSTSSMRALAGASSRAMPTARPVAGRSQQRGGRGPVSSRVRQLQAAAQDAPADDLAFSFSDAKRANEYSASDVEAGMRFYLDEGSAPSYEADFVTNTFGVEDASYFDDIDNNEAYAADEYIVAGIPEAAPKKRRADEGRGGPVR